MVTRNPRPLVRTPRKTKVWATETSTQDLLSTAGGAEPYANLLGQFNTDRGVNRQDRFTVMRIIGGLMLGNAATATSNLPVYVDVGIVWVRNQVFNATPGDAQIPDPGAEGVREIEWLWRQRMWYKPTASQLAIAFDQPMGQARLDIKQMRKAPTVDAVLAMIVSGNYGAADDLFLDFRLDTMLALP